MKSTPSLTAEPRECVCCKQVKPLEDFGAYYDPHGVRKYKRKCKACQLEYQREYQAKKRAIRDSGKQPRYLYDAAGAIEKKLCTACSTHKPLEAFAANCRSKDRVSSHCKECDKERLRKWRAENVERSRAAVKAYQAANREAVAARQRDWVERNRDRVRESQRRYRDKDVEAYRQYLRDWKERHPHKVSEYAEGAKKRAQDARRAATAMDVPLPGWRAAELRAQRRAEYTRAWAQKNADKRRAAAKKYRSENLEAARAKGRALAAVRRATPEGQQNNRDNASRWRKQYPERYKASWTRYYQANKQRVADYKRQWSQENRAHLRAQGRIYRGRPEVADRRDRVRRLWVELNRDRLRDARIARRGRRLPWVTRWLLLPFFREARRRSSLAGVRHEVDHIYPLVSPYVCGLDVPANLRVVTQFENRSKGNRIHADLLHEMWGVPEIDVFYPENWYETTPVRASNNYEGRAHA